MRFSIVFALLAFAVHAPAQVLTASKILSGSGTDAASAIATDSQGNVFVAGATTSADFPIVNGLISRIADASLRVSIDGQTFTPAPLAPSSVNAIGASSDGRTILAADGGSIYRSLDGGATWNSPPSAISGYAIALAVDPMNPSNAYAVANLNSSTVFYRSADGGLTWQSESAVCPQQSTAVSRIVIDPANSASIYAFFSNGLYHSTDSGATWQQTLIPGVQAPEAFALAPSQPQTIYAIFNFGPAQKSVDGGATWQSIASFATSDANTFAVDPQNPQHFWFTYATNVYRSADGGASVQLVAQLSSGTWQSIAIDPANSSHIFAADASNLYASLDDGATWNVVARGQFSGLLATPLAIWAAGAVPPTLFLAKLDPTLTQVLFSTYIGPVQPKGIALAVDAAGNALVTGSTQSPDFPTTATALQTTLGTGSAGSGSAGGGVAGTISAGFAVEVRADGGALLYSTFLNNFSPGGAAFDSSGNAVIVGAAQSGFAVTANAYQATIPGPCTRQPLSLNLYPPAQTGHAYVARLSSKGSSLLYGSYLTGSCGDTANAVQLDAAGNMYITGFTYSQDFPLTASAISSTFPNTTLTSGFVAELSADGGHLLYSSLFGGGENNSGNAIALDGRGDVYVGGYTQATASPGALAVANPKGCEYIINIGPGVDESFDYIDGFVMKLALTGAPAAYFATIGGSCQDSVQSLSLDGAGDVWVAGTTASADFPLKAPAGAFGAPIVTPGAGEAGFVTEIDPTGSNLLFSTFAGSFNVSPGVAATRSGAYVASAITVTPKSGAASATSAIAAYIDGSQSPPIAIDSIQAASAPGFASLPELPFFTPPAVAPGELVVLNGRGIGPATAVTAKVSPGGVFAGTLGGVQVSFNGIAAPVISVQANQIECQAPFELDGAVSAEIQVTYNGQTSNSFPAAVIAQVVSVLAVSNADGTPNSAANPAKIGSTIAIYLNGLGQTVPAGVDGALNGSSAILPRTLPAVFGAQPIYLAAAPGESTGVSQLNVAAPFPQAGSAAGSISIEGGVFPYEVGVPIYVLPLYEPAPDVK